MHINDNPFDALGLERSTATKESVTIKWRELARLHHPDKGGSAEDFDRIKKAYTECLELIIEPITQDECKDCGGTGRVGRGHGWTQVTCNCNSCEGSGKV